MGTIRDTLQNKPPVIFLVIIFVLLICLLLTLLLLRSGLLNDVNQLIGLAPTSDATEIVDETAIGTNTPLANTSTPTPVILNETATPLPTETPTPTSIPTQIQPSEPPTATPISFRIIQANVFQAGDFEQDFNIPTQPWQRFSNGGAIVTFANERWPEAIRTGESALRLSISDAQQPDRYAGIYQQIEVVPGQEYTLNLYGQIRSSFGAVSASQYGYRLYYALDWLGGTDWETIPDGDWLELPWDEQLIDDGQVQYLDYTTTVVPVTRRLTVFLRAHNKWALPYEAQFTFDDVSFIGPKVIRVIAEPDISPAPIEELVDIDPLTDVDEIGQVLPTTGKSYAHQNQMSDPRLWLSAITIILLISISITRSQKRRPRL
ncbi:MAG: hypothetical protein AAF629_35665 [Chloroflexota bacterium]